MISPAGWLSAEVIAPRSMITASLALAPKGEQRARKYAKHSGTGGRPSRTITLSARAWPMTSAFLVGRLNEQLKYRWTSGPGAG